MASSAKTILLVEDEVDILDEVASYLRRRDFRVVTAPTLNDGMLALTACALHPDILLTDVRLPDGSGLALLDQVRDTPVPPPKPRVIVMTGHLDAEAVEHAKSSGAEAVLLKPFKLSTLLGYLRESHA